MVVSNHYLQLIESDGKSQLSIEFSHLSVPEEITLALLDVRVVRFVEKIREVADD